MQPLSYQNMCVKTLVYCTAAGLALLSLVLCDDAHMVVLNQQHRGKEGPTDVLSFDMTDELDFKVGAMRVSKHDKHHNTIKFEWFCVCVSVLVSATALT